MIPTFAFTHKPSEKSSNNIGKPMANPHPESRTAIAQGAEALPSGKIRKTKVPPLLGNPQRRLEDNMRMGLGVTEWKGVE
jgi:hypothetical protein